jgi:membrane-associated phospholipid phosphatase
MAVKIIGQTTTVLVSGSVFAAIAWYRDAITFSLMMGSVSNAILSKILKRLLKQSRPAELESSDLKSKPEDNGMPSSHAMSLGFICTYTALNAPWAQVLLAVYAVVSLIYRVQVKLHTWEQVVVGSVAGSFNGFCWYKLTIGDNPLSINVADWITAHVLDETGVLPYPLLIVPLVVGGLTVGSVERRIKGFLKSRKSD